MQCPPFLRPGDRIGVTSTARKIRPEELQAALDALRSWGLEPVTSPQLYAVDHQFAGTDAQRRSDLQGFLDDPSIRAILCARGGYGTQRIVDALDLSTFTEHPKWVMGFSDITSLLATFDRVGVASIHGPMGLSWDGKTSDADSREALRKLLFGEWPRYDWAPHPLNRSGTATARLVGGNLSIVHCNLATATQTDTRGTLLFLEDLDEYLYHLDRMLVHLKRAGQLRDLAGLVVGGMTDMNDNAQAFGRTAEEIIREAVEEYDYPVTFGFPAGHQPANYPLVIGAAATLEVEANRCTLSFVE